MLKLLLSPGVSIKLRWAGHVAIMEGGRSAFKILTGTPKGKRYLGREDTIRMDLKDIGNSTSNSVESAQDRELLESLLMRH